MTNLDRSNSQRRHDVEGRPLCFVCGLTQREHVGGVECDKWRSATTAVPHDGEPGGFVERLRTVRSFYVGTRAFGTRSRWWSIRESVAWVARG